MAVFKLVGETIALFRIPLPIIWITEPLHPTPCIQFPLFPQFPQTPPAINGPLTIYLLLVFSWLMSFSIGAHLCSLLPRPNPFHDCFMYFSRSGCYSKPWDVTVSRTSLKIFLAHFLYQLNFILGGIFHVRTRGSGRQELCFLCL